MSKPILLIDFDGVLHSYTSGWQGANVVSDTPVPGALEFLATAVDNFAVCIYSSRSRQWGGVPAMKRWLRASYIDAAVPYDECPEWLRTMVAKDSFADPWEEDARWKAIEIIRKIKFPFFKPPAFLTLDDRCICFNGTWPSIEDLRDFKPWNKQAV